MNEIVKGELIRETGLAILFRQGKREFWIPRSIISYMKKNPELEMHVPAWWLTKPENKKIQFE